MSPVTGTTFRGYRPDDAVAVVDLSLRAWAPVFASMEEVLGSEIFVLLHGDWRRYQERAVRSSLADDDLRIWVAERGHEVVGFVAGRLDAPRLLGEIWMVAVDPGSQGQGVGLALTALATDWFRDAGMKVAMVATGGDPGHAPARHVYEKAQYTLMPSAQYFKAL
jgi:ribosomal protein S18 acetylase RimI-like enzyme